MLNRPTGTRTPTKWIRTTRATNYTMGLGIELAAQIIRRDAKAGPTRRQEEGQKQDGLSSGRSR